MEKRTSRLPPPVSSLRMFWEAIERTRKPALLPEGETDVRYLEKASQVLGREQVLQAFEVRDGGGAGNLTNMFRDLRAPLPEFFQRPVVLLFDCDKNKPNNQKGRLYRRTIPLKADNPIKEGIENLFGSETLERARQHDPAFVDVEERHESQVKGQKQVVPEKWTVNPDRKGWSFAIGSAYMGQRRTFEHSIRYLIS